MLGGLAAEQRAAGATASLRDAFHQRRHLLRHDLAHREVVEEEQRLGARAHDVVRAHRHEVDADGVEAAERARDLELRADAVGGGGQEPAVADPEEPREPADAFEHLGTACPRREVADQRDGLGRGLGVDAGVAIGAAHVGGQVELVFQHELAGVLGDRDRVLAVEAGRAEVRRPGPPVAAIMPSCER